MAVGAAEVRRARLGQRRHHIGPARHEFLVNGQTINYERRSAGLSRLGADEQQQSRVARKAGPVGVRGEADPATIRGEPFSIPAKLTEHARRRELKFDPAWPASHAAVAAWDRVQPLPAPDRPPRTDPTHRKEEARTVLGKWKPARPRRHADALPDTDQPSTRTGTKRTPQPTPHAGART